MADRTVDHISYRNYCRSKNETSMLEVSSRMDIVYGFARGDSFRILLK